MEVHWAEYPQPFAEGEPFGVGKFLPLHGEVNTVHSKQLIIHLRLMGSHGLKLDLECIADINYGIWEIHTFF